MLNATDHIPYGHTEHIRGRYTVRNIIKVVPDPLHAWERRQTARCNDVVRKERRAIHPRRRIVAGKTRVERVRVPRRQRTIAEADEPEDRAAYRRRAALRYPLWRVFVVEVRVPRAVFWVPAVEVHSFFHLLSFAVDSFSERSRYRVGRDVPFQSSRAPPQCVCVQKPSLAIVSNAISFHE